MLRISRYKAPEGGLRIILEGKLKGAWVDEVERCWRDSRKCRRISVDLNDVTFVDDHGKILLREMWSAGVKFIARGPLIIAILEEIKSDCIPIRA